MRILLTGAAGLVGSHVLHVLLEAGHTVIATDIVPLPSSILDRIPSQHNSFLTHHVLDLTDYKALDALLDSLDGVIHGVIHLGAIPNPLRHDPRQVYNNNVTSNYNILQTCANRGIHRVVQASSVNAPGLSYTPAGHQRFDELPITEETPLRAVSKARGGYIADCHI
jgi:nucleoside-diphosphate-sugar epimerase